MIEILVDGEWVEGQPSHGDKYKETKPSGTVVISYWNEQTYLTKYSTANESITINGNAPTGKQSVYFAADGDSVSIQADIVDGSDSLQTQIDQTALNYPPVLVVPVMKYANKQVIDEVYFQASINNGVLTASGTLPSAGNWKMTTERVNESLAAIGADWKFSDALANFIVR